ncbi:MAG: phosphatidate cytidylyltransferase [Promethearchaeota archaeon]|jgi:CDP-diglyceride synthetase
MNITSVIIICLLYSYGLFLLYVTYLTKKKGDKGAFINNAANSIVFIISITINLILINVLNPFSAHFIAFPFDFLMLGFVIVFIPIFYILVIKEKKNITKGKSTVEEFSTRTKDLPLKYDIYRKLTHLVVLGIIFFYFTLGFLIQNFFIYILDFLPSFFIGMFDIGDDIMIFTQNLVVFLVGVSLIGLLTADFTRILKPRYYPLKVVNQILKKKELHMRLGPHISMSIGCFSIILLYGLVQPIGPLIICTSMAMTVLGDTSSNLIGRVFGRKKIRDTNKTYEGLIAGIIVAFVFGLIVLILLQNFYFPRNLGLIFIPLIGAIIIGLIDYLDLEVDDNLSYICVLSTILFFSTILLF